MSHLHGSFFVEPDAEKKAKSLLKDLPYFKFSVDYDVNHKDYGRHSSAMTSQDMHSKGDLVDEFILRDNIMRGLLQEIEKLRAEVKALTK